MATVSEQERNQAPNGAAKDEAGAASRWKLPYYAVIFTSRRLPSSNEASAPGLGDDYGTTAKRMFELAKQQPGYLGFESHRTEREDGAYDGVTVSYWTDTQSIKAWRLVSEHADARKRGRTQWYKHWNVRVAKVEREYGGSLDDI